jgi:geranylgeranyl diphosphate synthase type II
VDDLASEGRKISLKKLKRIHALKTGALLRACVRGSTLICNASPAKIKALTSYAEHLGLAFQVADDILDATSDRKELGKPVKADVKKGFPYLIGVEASRQLAEAELDRAINSLKIFGRKAEPLREIANYVLSRKN